MGDREFEAITGDHDLVRSKAQHYAYIAGAIKRSVTTLDALRDVGGMQSKAIDAIRAKAGEVSEDINKAQARYAVTADALITYAASLNAAQEAGDLALRRIGNTQDTVDAAHGAERKARDEAEIADADQVAHQTAAATAHSATIAAGRHLEAAQAEWHAAVDMKNVAAGIATTAIIEVVEGAKNKGLSDSMWDNWGSTLFEILKVVCKWAGVLAIFLAWVPFLGPILIVLAAVGAAIDLIEASIKYANGEGSLGDVLLSAAGAVLAVFGGKIFAMLATKLKAISIVKSGVTEASQLARLQGVGRHSPAFMSAAKAAEGLAKPMNTAFKAPFVRSDAAKASYDAFKAGAMSGREAIQAATKEAFPGIKLSLQQGLGVNSDLVGFYRIARANPNLVDLPMAVGAGALSVYQGYAMTEKLTDLSVPGFIPGEYSTVGGAVSATAEAYGHAQQVLHGDLPK